ncbi:MAG TPA: hypothetical protein PKY81_16725 [bacterium]|nr:hypothetical protein [bacterium]HPN32598.1 hypothetical protein [bacterium]
MEGLTSFIDQLDVLYWIIILLMLFVTIIMLYIFYMIRSRKELEYLEYEIKENEHERNQFAKMRDELRKF